MSDLLTQSLLELTPIRPGVDPATLWYEVAEEVAPGVPAGQSNRQSQAALIQSLIDGGVSLEINIIQRLNPRPPYEPDAIYSLFDYLYLGGARYAYINSVPSVGNPPPNTDYWLLISEDGVDGANGSRIFHVTSAPDGALGEVNDTAIRDNGQIYQKTGVADWTLTADLLTQAEADALYTPIQGAAQSGLRYNLNLTPTSPPAAGQVRFNSTTIASVTQIFVHESDRNNAAQSELVDAISIGTRIQIAQEDNEEIYGWFRATGAPTDNGTWRTIPVALISPPSAPFTAGEVSIDLLQIQAPSSGGVGGIGLTRTFDTTTTAGADDGRLRLNDVDPASATAIYISESTIELDGQAALLNKVAVGNLVQVADLSNGKTSTYTVISITDEGAYRTLLVQYRFGTAVVGDFDGPVLFQWLPDSPGGPIGVGSQLLASGLISATATANSIVINSAVAASGGVPPYTYAWYKGTSSGFAVGAGSLISGATGAGYTDSGLPASTNFFYRRVVTDGLGNKVSTDELQAATSAPTAQISDTFTRTGNLLGSNVDLPSSGVTYQNYFPSWISPFGSGSVVGGAARGNANDGCCVRLGGATLGQTYSITLRVDARRDIAVIVRASNTNPLEGIWISFRRISARLFIDSMNSDFEETAITSVPVTFPNGFIDCTINVTATAVQVLIPSLSVNLTATTALYNSNSTAGLYFDAFGAVPDQLDSWSFV